MVGVVLYLFGRCLWYFDIHVENREGACSPIRELRCIALSLSGKSVAISKRSSIETDPAYAPNHQHGIGGYTSVPARC